jgi:hypothetical protein
MNIPQIKSTLAILLVIIIGTPLVTCLQLYSVGELQGGFQGFANAFVHGLFNATMLAIGWLLFRSPFAGKITEILQASKTITPSGAVTEQSTKVTVQDPTPQDEKK